ncbi:MAG: recombinase family protein [Hyphomonas sp.]|nr:recombinase family protein [Hyphomonas sp.]
MPPSEAYIVSDLFKTYVRLGNVRELKRYADQAGHCTKTRTLKSEKVIQGKSFTRGRLYHLLSNPIYVGKIQHKSDHYEGVHDAIIDETLWAAVQERLEQNRVARQSRSNVSNPSPLAGKVFDQEGRPLTSDHACKKGRRYRYYVSRDQKIRLPASELEAATRHALEENRDLTLHLQQVGRADVDRLDLVRKVNVIESSIQIELNEGVHPGVIKTKFILRKRGVELKLVLSAGTVRAPDLTLVKRILRAMTWLDQIKLGKTISEIAKAENVTPEYVTHNLGLSFLSPRVLKAIASGNQRPEISAYKLSKMAIPEEWNGQDAIFLERN